jgi:hypothetical protein
MILKLVQVPINSVHAGNLSSLRAYICCLYLKLTIQWMPNLSVNIPKYAFKKKFESSFL